MGTLHYGLANLPITIEDRALAHIKIVMLSKLRRGEGFGFSWTKGHEHGGGRCTAWIHPAGDLLFEFSGSREPTINRDWLEVLNRSAQSAAGMTVVPEPSRLGAEIVDPEHLQLKEHSF